VPCPPINVFSIKLTRLISNDTKRADQKPLTENPGITPEAIKSKRALITKVKRPRLRMFMGRVNTSRIGLKNAFKIPSRAAEKIAEKNPSILIPSNK